MAGDTIVSRIPDPDVLLAMSVDKLAFVVLKLAKQTRQNGLCHPDNMSIYGTHGPRPPEYARREKEVNLALAEAWSWLRNERLVVPAPGINGSNGFLVLSRAGEAAADSPDAFTSLQAMSSFPKSLLHPSIADKVWQALIRGDLGDAVFFAFRAVEEAVRRAASLKTTDIGKDLMFLAFNKDNGPLTDKSQPIAEREALAQLFAGAIGSYKNPHSHRTVTISDPRDAQEMVLLATHLLRIVDARAANVSGEQ